MLSNPFGTRASAARPPRFHYGWIVVAVTFAITLVAAGIRSMPSVLILPLEGEFGWSRATLSLAISVNLLLFGLCGPFASGVMARVGMARLMAGALALVALSLGLSTLMRDAWQLQAIWGMAIGTGVGALSGWMSATVANRWFAQRRGLVVGVLTAANTLGQMLFLPALALLIGGLGWRLPSLLVAGLALVLIPLALALVRDHPQDVGLRPFGANPEVGPMARPEREAGNPLAAAVGALGQGMRHQDFLLLAGSFFICGATSNGLIGTHLIPASVEHGMSELTAAGFLAAIGVFSTTGAMLSGWLSDRFDNRRLLAWYYGLRGLSLLLLPYAYERGTVALALFVVFDGLDWAATVPPTIRLTADRFGRQRVGTVYAWIFASHQLGAAAIAYAAGTLRTWLGDYNVSFMVSGALCMAAVAMVLRIGQPARTDRLPEHSAKPLPVPR